MKHAWNPNCKFSTFKYRDPEGKEVGENLG